MIRSFMYRAFIRLRFPYSSLVYCAFVSCIVRSLRVSCIFCIVHVKRLLIFRSFRLRLLRILILYDPRSVPPFYILPDCIAI